MSSVAAENAPPGVEQPDFWIRYGGAIAWAFVALGIAVRLVRYLLRFHLWGDEMMLAANLHDRDYAGLAAGLDHWQVAPVGYLWAQKAVVEAFGFHEYSLRAVALVAGIGGLVLFRIAAGYVLRGLPLVLAVAFLATAYYPIRHAAEVKPYAGDLFAAVLLLEPLLAWLGDPSRVRALWRLAPAVTVALTISFPAAFVAGGVSAALAYEAWRRRDRAALAPWLCFNIATAGTFLLLFVTVMQSHYSANGATMHDCWDTGFPPSPTEPLKLLAWLATAHSGEMLAYPVGGDNGGSAVQLLSAIVGAVVLWRSPRSAIVVAAAACATLGLVAAALHRYPYGYGSRLLQYWGPLACLLIGSGAAAALAALRNDVLRKHATRGVLIACTLVGGGILIRDLTHPYKIVHDARHRDFSRWFWRYAGEGEPLVDLEADLGTPLFDSFRALSYRTYRQIYALDAAPVAAGPMSAALARLPSGVPIRCAAFARFLPPQNPWQFIEQQFERVEIAARYALWRVRMSRSYRLVDVRTYAVQVEVGGEPAAYHVWRFEPKSPAAHLRTALPLQATHLR